MTATTSEPSVFDHVYACVQHLGAAVLAIWGVTEEGVCLCNAGPKCKSPGKHPNHRLCPNGFKNASREPAIIRQWARQAPKGNWAIRCGDPLPGGGFLAAFDWDPRNGALATLEELKERGDELPETVAQVSGGGGGHRLYRFEHSPAGRSVGPGLDLQGAGKYIVISPSRHASGGVYAWELGQAPGDVEVAPAPVWLEAGTDEAVPRPEVDAGSARETILGEAFTLANRAGPVMPDGTMFVNCVQSHLHSDARGRGEDASTIILPPAGGSRFGGYKCLHGHCANLKWKDVLDQLPKEAVDAAYSKYPRLSVVRAPEPSSDDGDETPDSERDESSPRTSTLSEDERKDRELLQRLDYKQSKGGGAKLKNDIINAATILTFDRRWTRVIRWDDFGQTIRFTSPAPWHENDGGFRPSEVWSDEDTTRLEMWYRRNFGLELKSTAIREVVAVVAKRDAYNPLQDYLNGIAWDGVPRLETWLSAYAGCDDTPYARIVGKKWMLSAVARAFDQGCKVDTCLVLEGPQGKGKSTLLRMLVPNPAWFSDTPIDLASKDAYVALRGKWIIELAELASLKKADLDRTKAFFSSPVDSYRPPYGREQISVPRTAVFAGSVNLGEYLNDPTGARRFLPVRCGEIDLTMLIADRDQLWAEAVSIYKGWKERGSPQSEYLWWPSPDDLPLLEQQQAERQVAGAEDPDMLAVAYWLKTSVAREMLKARGHFILRDICKAALAIEDKDITRARMTTLGIIMLRDLKYLKIPVRVAGVKTTGYVPNELAPSS